MKVARFTPLIFVLLSMTGGSFLARSDAPNATLLGTPTFNGTPAPLDKMNACTPLSAGDYINTNDLNAPFAAAYKLIRSKPDLYEAALNLNFVPEKDSGLDRVDTQQNGAALFNRCFSALGDIVSKNGSTRLRVRLPLPEDPGEPAAPVNVTITPKWMARVDRSTYWSLQSDCPTIVHETMHLLGLVDEYKETQIGTSVDANGKPTDVLWNAQSTDFDCRAAGPKDSVMTDMDTAVAAVSGGYRSFMCACTTSACAKKLDALSGPVQTCPSGTDASSFPLVGDDAYHLNTDAKAKSAFNNAHLPLLQGQRVNRWIYQSDVRTPPARAWLLYPAEFRAITSPACLEQNPIYYRCILNAYMTSTTHSGQGCYAGLPKECSDRDAWLQ